MKSMTIEEFVNEEKSAVEADLIEGFGPDRKKALALVGGGIGEILALKILLPIVISFAKDQAIKAYKHWNSEKEVRAALASIGSAPAKLEGRPDIGGLRKAMEQTLVEEGVPAAVASGVVDKTIRRVEQKLRVLSQKAE
jgi:hypothetical protein